MPEVRNCKKCGKIFTYTDGIMICPICKENDENDFKKVKDYLYENPGATVLEVSTALNISIGKIKSYLRDGRLEIIGDKNMILECEKCGKAISSGQFCLDCAKNLGDIFKFTAKTMGNSIEKSRPDSKSIGMRHLDKDTGRYKK